METVETERLLLRPWLRDDEADYFRIFAKPELGEFPFGRALTNDEIRSSFEHRIAAGEANAVGAWAAVIKSTNTVIGWIGLSFAGEYPDYEEKLQVGWRLDPLFWGNGYATEGGRASVTYGFGNLVDEIYVFAQPTNTASIRVAERLGASVVGGTYARVPGMDAPVPTYVMVLTKDQWTAV